MVLQPQQSQTYQMMGWVVMMAIMAMIGAMMRQVVKEALAPPEARSYAPQTIPGSKDEIRSLLDIHTTVESWGKPCITNLASLMGKPVPTTREGKARLINQAKEHLQFFPQVKEVTATGMRPAYEAFPGIYDWDYLRTITPQSASNAAIYAHALHYLPLSAYKWKYMQVPLWKIDQDDRWYSTMARFLSYNAEEVDEAIAARRVSLSDYAVLSEEGKYYVGRDLTPEEEREAYAMFGQWLKGSIKRCRWIYAELVATKTYYPPVLSHDYSTLNGAHRAAVLWKEFGPEFEVWAWLMQERIR